MAARKQRLTSIHTHFDKQYGKPGTRGRTEFEIGAKAFMIGELIKAKRRQASMTQEELAERIGAKKSFISRIENGRSDIQLSTLFRLIEYGLGRKVEVVVK